MPYHRCQIDEDLRDRGLYKTGPRHRILELFHEPRPWSADDIAKKIHAIGLTTIYRTLGILVDRGVIVPLHAHDDRILYERAGQTHHDHLQCARCTKVECLPCPVPQLQQPHILEVTGTCKSCLT